MIELDHTPTLPASLRHYVAQYSDREFLVQGERRLSFRDLERESARLARGMLARGIGKGTRVGILMPDGCDWVIAFMAAARIGAFCVLLSTLYQPRELRWVIQFADLDTLLMADGFLHHDYLERLEEALPSLAKQGSGPLHLPEAPYLRTVAIWGEGRRAWGQRGPDYYSEDLAPEIDEAYLRAVEDCVTPADLMLMIFTSGTTANPKGVPHTHGTVIRHTHVLLRVWPIEPGDRILQQMPFFWLGGLNTTLIPGLFLGAAVVFPPSRDLGELIELVERERITWVAAGWGPQIAAMQAHPAYSESKMQSLRPTPFSFFPPLDAEGNPIPAERFTQCLGMTESFGPHGEWSHNEPLPEDKLGSKGRTVDGLDRIVVDPETGETLPPGKPGELWVRGYSLTPGLYKQERHEVFTPDGYYRTGDLCTLDADAYVYFHGRAGDMVKVRGANVSTREVEMVLESFDEVQEAVVYGVPEDDFGSRLVAVVTPADGHQPKTDELLDRLKGELSAYKVPRAIHLLRHEQIPRTASGKAIKRQLMEALEDYAAGAAQPRTAKDST